MKIITGKVVSIKMKDTATVAVERVVVHPMYKKRFRRIKKYHVHDELGVEVGQEVKFVACKPYSKLKRWKIVEVVSVKSGKKKGKSK
ncbi:30S ribosomal protein S17 [Patescibacteria group bacterium]